MDLVYRLKLSSAKVKELKEENKRLRHELEMALESLKWSRDKLVNTQFELMDAKRLLVRAVEGRY